VLPTQKEGRLSGPWDWKGVLGSWEVTEKENGTRRRKVFSVGKGSYLFERGGGNQRGGGWGGPNWCGERGKIGGLNGDNREKTSLRGKSLKTKKKKKKNRRKGETTSLLEKF